MKKDQLHFKMASLKLMVLLSMLAFGATQATADQTNYLISSNQQVWAIIKGKSAPKPNSFSVVKTRETNAEITKVKYAPIDFKQKKFGIKEAYSPTATSVAGRGGVLTSKPDYAGTEASTTFYGNASQKKLPQHARVKNTRISEIRESNLMIQQLILNSRR